MKKVAVIVLLALAVGILLAVPLAGSAANCRNNSPRPTPPSGATDLPDGGKAWADPAAGAGANGPHGYLVVKQTATGVQVYGHNTDTGVNGDVNIDQTNPSRICIDTTGS